MRKRKIVDDNLIDTQIHRIQISTLVAKKAFISAPTSIYLYIREEDVEIHVTPNLANCYTIDTKVSRTGQQNRINVISGHAPNGGLQYYFICPKTNKKVRTLFIIDGRIVTRYQANLRYTSQVRHKCTVSVEELGGLYSKRKACYKDASRQALIFGRVANTYFQNFSQNDDKIKFSSYSKVLKESRSNVDLFLKERPPYDRNIEKRKNRNLTATTVSNSIKRICKKGPIPSAGAEFKINSGEFQKIRNNVKDPNENKDTLKAQSAEAFKKYGELTERAEESIQEFLKLLKTQ